MEASVVDLRYKAKDILKALDRNESVDILYRGKPKAIIHPISKTSKKDRQNLKTHPFFGMYKDEEIDVDEIMDELRGSRYAI